MNIDLLHLGTSQGPAANKVGVTRSGLARDLFVAFLLTACATANAATISAASCAAADVQEALNRATAGDTVVIPAGSANWTQKVSWSAPANVTLKGAGTTATGGGDQTVITDNLAAGTPILAINIASSGVFRMTGITFQSGSGSIKYGGVIRIDGPGKARVDHCRLNMTTENNYKAIVFGAGLRGVLDRCILDFKGTCALYFYNGRDNGTGGGQGNYEWTQPTAFGSDDYFFVEDNIITGTHNWTSYDCRIFDGTTGAKVVVRFNTVVSATLAETHATGSSSDNRGLRSQEIYGNSVTSPLAVNPNYVMVDIASGTTLAWGNSAHNVYKTMFTLKVTRHSNATYPQSATPAGLGYAGTAFNGTGSMWDGGTALGTDTTTGYPCLDQPGRGQGDLLLGSFPNKINSRTDTISWPNQALEPVYLWGNTGSVVRGWGDHYFGNQSSGRVAPNRDYYPQASGIQTSPSAPFDGTSGTGWGTLANRPTTCTPGVAYFATDEGSWNTSTSNPYGVQQNGADGVLYTCTAPNTWTRYYEPYTYPHPIRLPGAPQNVKINVVTETTQ